MRTNMEGIGKAKIARYLAVLFMDILVYELVASVGIQFFKEWNIDFFVTIIVIGIFWSAAFWLFLSRSVKRYWP
ncbi:hypothetical protein HYT26_00865 [Candidatus Pacearchaeota archaeon]|nr:hypothetical protein [Candidatus Pacearchaeota archaeon]